MSDGYEGYGVVDGSRYQYEFYDGEAVCETPAEEDINAVILGRDTSLLEQEDRGGETHALDAEELEDAFAEVLRKSARSYGNRRLVEELVSASLRMGEEELRHLLVQATQRTVKQAEDYTQGGGALPSSRSRYMWNDAFQRVLEMKVGDERNERLAALRQDFVASAEVYGRIILSERFLPVYRKSIKPVELGGVAGGQKFICQGTLYKFARDVRLQNGSWMYGGDVRNDEAASKAAGNELRGLSAVFNAELELRVPLMCLVDFNGFRLSAQALVPVDTSTLVYGSCDGGLTIESGDKDMRVKKIMQKLADRLNLAPHIVLDGAGRRHEMCAPADIEVHLGTDGRFYCLDCARLLPPQYPPANRGRSVFYQLFRPEFLAFHKIKLSSDGFSNFGKLDYQVHNKALREATKRLRQERLPAFARSLVHSDAMHITSLMHSYGINVRFLGEVRYHVLRQGGDQTVLSKAIMCEMISRTLQKSLHAELRQEMERLRAPHTEPYLRLIKNFFNRLQQDADLWRDPARLKAAILRKYGNVALTPEENQPNYNLLRAYPLATILTRTAELSGIGIRSGVVGDASQFVTSDLSMGVRIREMDVASLALAEQYRAQSKSKQGHLKLELLEKSARILAKTAVSNPQDLRVALTWARVMVSKLRCTINEHPSMRQMQFDQTKSVLITVQSKFPPDALPIELLWLLSRYYRMSYRAGKLSIEALGHWQTAYLMTLACEKEGAPSLPVGGMAVRAKLEARKAKLLRELCFGLDFIVSPSMFEDVDQVFGECVRTHEPLWRFLLDSFNGEPDRKRLFGLLLFLMRGDATFMSTARTWLSSKRHVKVSRLCMGLLDNARVGAVLRCANTDVTVLDLTNAAHIDDDLSLLFTRLPNLQSLCLKRCVNVTDEMLTCVANYFPLLRHLTLYKCKLITDAGILKLGANSLLESLDLSKCLGLHGTFFGTKEGLQLPELRSLKLQGCNRFVKAALSRIHNTAFPKLQMLVVSKLKEKQIVTNQRVVKMLSLLPTLTALDLSFCRSVSEKAFRGLNASNFALTHLNLSFCHKLSDEALSYVSTLPNLSSLLLAGCDQVTDEGFAKLANLDQLVELSATGCPSVTQKGLAVVLTREFMQRCVRLKLPPCSVSPQCVQDILTQGKRLERLVISHTALVLPTVPSAHLSASLALSNLTSLCIESCSIAHDLFVGILRRCGHVLRKLTLVNVALLADRALLEISTFCRSMRSLVLGSMPFSDEGLSELASMRTLKRLALVSLPNVGDEGIKALGQPLVGNLRRLELRELQITDDAWGMLAHWGKNLKRLRLSRVEISNQADLLPQLPKLQVLSLGVYTNLHYGASAADLEQLRSYEVPADVASDQRAWKYLASSRSLQRLVCLHPVAPQWFSYLGRGPIAESLHALWVAGDVVKVLPHLVSLHNLTSLNIRESVAKQVLGDDVSMHFPFLVFGRSGLARSSVSSSAVRRSPSRESSMHSSSNTSLVDLDEEQEEPQDLPWAAVLDAEMDIQLEIAKLLLLERRFRVILCYRVNRKGSKALLEWAGKQQEGRVLTVKMSDMFSKDQRFVLEDVEALDLLVTGYGGPLSEVKEDVRIESFQEASLTKLLRETVGSVSRCFALFKPYMQESARKLCVVVSARLGSVSENQTGRNTSLRIATSALNQLMRCLSIDARQWGGTVVGLSPPDANYGGFSRYMHDEEADSVETAARKMVGVIVDLGIGDNGRWLDTKRREIHF